MRLCEKLKAMYKSGTKSYREIAVDLGYARMTVINWMNGSTVPCLHAIKCIADYYGMTMSELLEGVDEV